MSLNDKRTREIARTLLLAFLLITATGVSFIGSGVAGADGPTAGTGVTEATDPGSTLQTITANTTTDTQTPVGHNTTRPTTMSRSVAMQVSGTQSESTATGSSSGEAWPSFRFNAANTGHNPGTAGPVSNVSTDWVVQREAPVRSSPAVGNERVYVGNENGQLFGISASDGTIDWTVSLGSSIFSSPTVVGETVFVGSNAGLHAIDAKDGTTKWSARTGTQFASSPTFADGRVYAGTLSGQVIAVSAETGSVAWESPDTGPIYSSPAVTNERVYVGSQDTNMYAFDVATGDIEWTAQTGSEVYSSPAVANGQVYIGSYDGSVYAVDATNGQEEWATSTGGPVFSSPAVANGRVYVGSLNNSLYTLDAGDGTKSWIFQTGAGIDSSPAIADDTVYVGSEDGNVYAVDAASGKEVWRQSTGDVFSSPAVTNGHVYVGDRSGSIHAFTGDTGGSDGSEATYIQIVTEPATPYVDHRAQFYGNRLSDLGKVKQWQWSFGDGETAHGQRVMHAYDEAGTYRVTLEARTATGREVNVTKQLIVKPGTPPGFDVSVTPELNGLSAESVAVPGGVPLDLTYRATVSQPDRTKNVTFRLGNKTYVDSDGSDGWTVPVPVESLTDDTELTVTAYRMDGERAVTGRTLTVIDTPEWFHRLSIAEQLKERPVIVLKQTFPADGGGTSLTIPDKFTFGEEIEMPGVGSSQTSNTEVVVLLRANLRTGEGTLGVSGSQEYQLASALTASGSISGDGYFRFREMDVTGGHVRGQIGAESTVPPTGIPSPPVPPVVPPGAVNIYPIFGANVQADATFDEKDTLSGNNPVAFAFTGGDVTPDLYAKQEVGQKWQAFAIVVGLQEGIETTVPFESDPIDGSVYGEIYARAEAFAFSRRVSYPTGDDRFEYDFTVNTSGSPTGGAFDSVEAEPQDTGWIIQSSTGDTPPSVAKQRVAGGTTAASGQIARVTDTQRITNNRVADESPALVQTDSRFILAWGRQDPTKSALNGRDIYASTAPTADLEVDTPKAITDDNLGDFNPAAASTSSGETLVAFTTFNRRFDPANVSKPSDTYAHGEIRLARQDGANWSTPTFLTTNDAFDYNAQVVAHDDSWTVAWTHDADGNLTTWHDRSVKYVRYANDGTRGSVHTVESARLPHLTTGPDGTPRLAVLRMDDSLSSGTVEFVEINADRITPIESASVTGLTDLAVADETVAWTGQSTDTWVSTIRDGTRRNLTAPANVSSPQSIQLTARPNRLLLSFRSVTDDQPVAQAYYRPRINGEWQQARQYANGSAHNLTYWQASSVGTTNGFVSVLAGKELGTAQKHDLYGFQTQFRPDLTASVSANASTAAVGDTITLNYTVKNTGDSTAPESVLQIANGSESTQRQHISALAPGESTTGSLTTQLGAAGTITVVADPADEITEHVETNNADSVRLASTDLVVKDIDFNKAANSVRIKTAIGNPTNVTAPATTYRLDIGPNVTRRGTIPPIQAGGTTAVNETLRLEAARSAYPVHVEVNPNKTVNETDRTNNRLARDILEPDVRLTARQVNYYRQDGDITASVVLENRGLGTARGTLTVTDTKTGTTVATTSIDVAAANDSTEPRFRTVELPLSGVEVNDTLRVTATMQVNATAEPVRQSVVDRVRLNTTLRAPSGQLVANRSAIPPGEAVQVSAAGIEDVDGTITEYQWSITNGTRDGSGSTIVVTPASNATQLTVTAVVVDDDGLRTRRTMTLKRDDTDDKTVGGAVTFENATVERGSQTLTVDYVRYEQLQDGETVSEPYVVAVHRQTANGVSGPVGVSKVLDPGAHTNVPVRLDEKVTSNDTFDAIDESDTFVARLYRASETEELGTQITTDNGSPVEAAARYSLLPGKRVVMQVEPSTTVIRPDGTFVANVTVDANSRSVYGVQTALQYDAAALSVGDIETGPFLGGGNASVRVYDQQVDREAGTVHFAASRQGASEGVVGNGTVARVHFQLDDPAATAADPVIPLALNGVEVADAASTSLPARTDNATLRVNHATATLDIPNATVPLGDQFTATVAVNSHGWDVFGGEATLSYDETILSVESATAAGYLSMNETPTQTFSTVDDKNGSVSFGVTRLANNPRTGAGDLFKINFTVAESAQTPQQSDISLDRVLLVDSDETAAPVNATGDSVRVSENQPPRLTVTLDSTVNNRGSPLRIGVNAADTDGFLADLSIQNEQGTALLERDCTVDVCPETVSVKPSRSTWTGDGYGVRPYTVIVTDDDGAVNRTSVETKVYIAGDTNGDGIVNIYDAVAVGRSWQTQRGEAAYRDAADLNNDGTVNIYDAVSVGRNWQETA